MEKRPGAIAILLSNRVSAFHITSLLTSFAELVSAQQGVPLRDNQVNVVSLVPSKVRCLPQIRRAMEARQALASLSPYILLLHSCSNILFLLFLYALNIPLFTIYLT